MCGTSTGGIIALGLALGHPAQRLLDLYCGRGRLIFPPYRPRFLWKLFAPKYCSHALASALTDLFKNTTLASVRTRLCVPSMDIQTGDIRVFKSPHHRDFHHDQSIPAWEVGLATSAAPTYFPAARVDSGRSMIDGGVWANNPSLVGIGEARLLGWSSQQVELLSIGTGATHFSMTGRKARWAGLLTWGFRIVDVVLQAQAQSIHNVLRERPSGAYLPLRRYLRVDREIRGAKYRLDNATMISELVGFGQAAVVEHLGAAKSFCDGPRRGWRPQDARPGS